MIGELTNHVWQSTVFAIAAGLLTVAFRNDRAQIRYCLWLSAPSIPDPVLVIDEPRRPFAVGPGREKDRHAGCLAYDGANHTAIS
jgi:hypothetical protein